MTQTGHTASTSNSNTSQQVNPPLSDSSDGGVVTNSRNEQNKQAQPLHKFPEDISKGELDSPVQPKLHTYPWKYFGMNKSVKRRFQSSFFAEFPWLEYSVQQDAAYCFCCRYWSKESSPFGHQIGKPTGFSDWQHATGQKYGFTIHNSPVGHLLGGMGSV